MRLSQAMPAIALAFVLAAGAPAAARGHAHAGFHAHKAKKIRTFHPVKAPKKLKLFSYVDHERHPPKD